jgi:hypothetical protein
MARPTLAHRMDVRAVDARVAAAGNVAMTRASRPTPPPAFPASDPSQRLQAGGYGLWNRGEIPRNVVWGGAVFHVERRMAVGLATLAQDATEGMEGGGDA